MRGTRAIAVVGSALLAVTASDAASGGSPEAKKTGAKLSVSLPAVQAAPPVAKASRIHEQAGEATKARQLEALSQGGQKAAVMPEREGRRPGAGTALGEAGVRRGEGPDAHGLVRRAMGLRTPSDFGVDPSKPGSGIGRNTPEGGGIKTYGPGTAADALNAPSAPTTASDAELVGSDENVSGDTSETKSTYRNSDGTTTVVVTSMRGDNFTESVQTFDKNGKLTAELVTKIHAGTGEQTVVRESGRVNDEFRRGRQHAGQGAPDGSTVDTRYGDCNPVTGWNCPKQGRSDPMDVVKQPPSEETDFEGSAKPNVGAAAVTNPDEFHSVGGGTRRGGGGRPGDVVVDPEEIVPGPGVPGPS